MIIVVNNVKIVKSGCEYIKESHRFRKEVQGLRDIKYTAQLVID